MSSLYYYLLAGEQVICGDVSASDRSTLCCIEKGALALKSDSNALGVVVDAVVVVVVVGESSYVDSSAVSVSYLRNDRLVIDYLLIIRLVSWW